MDKSQYGRRDRLIQEKRHDTYREYEKLPEPSVCTECGSVFADGRWSWKDVPSAANKTVCPSCLRIKDGYPAGYVSLRGPFFNERKEEIMNLMHNEEEAEKGEHPMERIMAIEEQDDHTLITTTGVHIARRIGEAVHRAYQGDFSFQYVDGEKSIRVSWER